MLSSNSTVVLGNGLPHVWHAPVRDFDSVFVDYFLEGWPGGKQVSISLRNFAPMFVEMFLEKGGLNQVIFLDLFRFLLLVLAGGSYLSWYWYPPLSRASW